LNLTNLRLTHTHTRSTLINLALPRTTMKISALPFLAVVAASTLSVASGDSSMECVTALTALNGDVDFLAASTLYFEKVAAAQNVDESDTSICTQTDLTLNCVIPDPIEGAAEYSTACEEKGGTLNTADADFHCTEDVEGVQNFVSFDFPSGYFCIPAGCDAVSMSADIDESIVQGFAKYAADTAGLEVGACTAGALAAGAGEDDASSGANTSFLPSLIMGGLVGIAFVFSS
jgi:hypothetical protein